MLGLIREMLHYRNNLGNKELDALIVGVFKKDMMIYWILGTRSIWIFRQTILFAKGWRGCIKESKNRQWYSEVLIILYG